MRILMKCFKCNKYFICEGSTACMLVKHSKFDFQICVCNECWRLDSNNNSICENQRIASYEEIVCYII